MILRRNFYLLTNYLSTYWQLKYYHIDSSRIKRTIFLIELKLFCKVLIIYVNFVDIRVRKVTDQLLAFIKAVSLWVLEILALQFTILTVYQLPSSSSWIPHSGEVVDCYWLIQRISSRKCISPLKIIIFPKEY